LASKVARRNAIQPSSAQIETVDARGPRYLAELTRYVEDNLDAPLVLAVALAALLADPEAYEPHKGQPSGALADFVQELVLTDRPLQLHLSNDDTPVSRELLDGKWTVARRKKLVAGIVLRLRHVHFVCRS
jgi:hypothetical protein